MTDLRHHAVPYDGDMPPLCDICSRPQCAEPTCPLAEWDDELGTHPLCEYQRSERHEHVWGPVEWARFTGNPHRKCQGCSAVSLDLDDD